MNRKPDKRRLTWFGSKRPDPPNTPYPPITPKSPNTLGAMWRQEPQGREKTDSWLLREPQAPDAAAPRKADMEPYPNLPVWPPQPERDRFGASSASDDMYGKSSGDSPTDERGAPTRTQPDAPKLFKGRFPAGKLRGLWWNVAASLRRPRMALIAGVSVFALCSFFGAAALGAAVLHSGSNSAQATPGAGSANGAVMPPSAGEATPSVTTTTTTTATPGITATPSPLTIAFTCASGTAGGTGQLCVSTLPHATLSLSVRYCDGSYAKGKIFHGVAYADGSGNYTWRWNVNTTCLGAATATVTARSAGQTLTQSTTFTVTR